MNRDKVLELAREADACHDDIRVTPFLERFAALIEREVRVDAEPVAFEFQHEDTGLIDFVDPQQVEWGFQKNNPRWQLIGPVFRHPAPAVMRQLVDALSGLIDFIEIDNLKIDQDALRIARASLSAAKEAGL